ncbi:hypothetical protein HP546_02530 [Pseudomonas sp. CM25]|uniref:hypothetical protein n=1 Tax=Pseudomonas sp. CM25 TaxID=2738448 RepID=UPI0015558752|nr:hypothetical protein [Pseudomonas sp. CM25]NQD54240.1 hypothetical protein [Pseudomonas sp. CM25]
MILENIVVNKEIILETLHTQWSRDPRDGKALDCLHFDEYCVERLEVKNGINFNLFSVEAGLKAALKHYVPYVVLYKLGHNPSEVEDQEKLEDVKRSIAKNVDDNWSEYHARIKKDYSRFVEFLSSDAKFYS